MSAVVVLAAVAALLTADARTVELNAPPPNMQLATDATTQLSVGAAMTKSTYKVGDLILVYLVLHNRTNHDVSAFHLPGEISITRVGAGDNGVDFGFATDDESRPPSITGRFGELIPGATYNSMFVLSDHGHMPRPGTYRVQVKVTILRSLLDHRPIGVVSPPPIEFTVTP